MKKFKRVGLFNSDYSLFLYLLSCSKEDIDSTFFFFSDGIPSTVRLYYKKQSYYLPKESNSIKDEIKQIIRHFIANIKWPFLKDAEYFGMPFCFVEILGNHSIVQVEDGFEHIGLVKYLYHKRKFHNIRRYLHGHWYDNYRMDSDKILKFILTKKISNELVKAPQNIISLETQWNNDINVQKEILLSHSISEKDIKNISKCKILLLTQTFAEDGVLSLDEEIAVYKDIISAYDENEILIKPHPRSFLDKKTPFKEAIYFDKTCPVQMLALCGFKPEVLITVNSTSVYNTPFRNVRIEFRGTEGIPSLIQKFGEIKHKIIYNE